VRPDSVVGTAPKLRVARSGVLIQAKATDYFLFQIVQTSSEAHSASCSIRTGVLSRRYRSRGMTWKANRSGAEVKNE
jgi:hypothetical protein